MYKRQVHILETREYTGCLVNFKTEKLSYKVKHSVENPPEKQAIFENHHEPIIDTQTWERVQMCIRDRGKGVGYDRWAAKHNLKQMAATVTAYQQYGFSSPEELDEACSAAYAAMQERWH